MNMKSSEIQELFKRLACPRCGDPGVQANMLLRDYRYDPPADLYFCTALCRHEYHKAVPDIVTDKPEE